MAGIEHIRHVCLSSRLSVRLGFRNRRECRRACHAIGAQAVGLLESFYGFSCLRTKALVRVDGGAIPRCDAKGRKVTLQLSHGSAMVTLPVEIGMCVVRVRCCGGMRS